MHPIKILSALALALLPSAALAHHSGGHGRVVEASVYHPDFHGGITYCGQRYQHWGVSAAHPFLPCGTRLAVSHKGRSIRLVVNDRCDNCGRLDLSAGAAYRLGVPLDGLASVRIREL